MTRVKTANGKRKPIGTQVSEPVYEAVESARGGTDRSAWIRGLILAELARQGISTEPHDEDVPVVIAGETRRPRKAAKRSANGHRAVTRPPPVVPAHPAGAGVFQEPGGEPVVTAMPPVPAVQRQRCTHPGTRMIGGFCPACDHVVEPGGYWRENA